MARHHPEVLLVLTSAAAAYLLFLAPGRPRRGQSLAVVVISYRQVVHPTEWRRVPVHEPQPAGLVVAAARWSTTS
jgi:hypothetical protein